MDGRNIEARTTLWAVAEVWWEDPTGKAEHVPATLEDTSTSGACIRVKKPFAIGARVVVKWRREQFSAVARNCRSDGRDFLLGVRREPTPHRAPAQPPPNKPALPTQEVKSVLTSEGKRPQTLELPLTIVHSTAVPAEEAAQATMSELKSETAKPSPATVPVRAPGRASQLRDHSLERSAIRRAEPASVFPSRSEISSLREERKTMSTKTFFPKFWQRQREASDAPSTAIKTEAPVNNSHSQTADGLTGPQNILLSYDDIYHAAGIMSPRSGYGVHKVVEMLNSDRIRELSKDVKRASVLMALDAAGTSPDDLLQDATRRQHALDTYEAGQQKQLEEFETRKAQENARIQAEMERLTAHYAERIKQNLDQIAKEKEALRGWQMAKQYESQRISEVIELCAKQPVSAAASQPARSTASGTVAPTSQPVTNQALKTSAGGH